MYVGKTDSDKIHELTLAVLPIVLEEAGIPCTVDAGNGEFRYNTKAIVDTYNSLFRKLSLEKYGCDLSD